METVFIDGSTGEGGGQILRTSLALSCITGRSLHIENIRAARPKPGLAKQHLSCVQAACQICNGKCGGASQGSKVLDFQPRPVHSGDFYFDIGSAGSVSLVIQTILPALFLADKPSRVTIIGGTHNPLAPPVDFLCETFLPAIAAGGFLPAGGGKITFDIQPWQKQSHQIIDFCQPSEQFQINARIYTAQLPAHIAHRQRELLLQSRLSIQNIEHIEVTDSDGPGNCVMVRLWGSKPQTQKRGFGQAYSSRTTVFTAFGTRGKPSQDVVGEVVGLAEDFLNSGAAVDRFLADQLLIYMAILKAGCYTTNELSTHLLTNMGIIKKFLPVNFDVNRQQDVYKVSYQPA
jgi:RNA 3'-terminal phosphate cyclase (ATP)